MSIHRRAAKRDKNEAGIVKVLRAHGCVVWPLSGAGVPDLLVMRKGRTWLADVKDGNGKATPAQAKAWEEAATKARVAVFVLRSPADAVAMLNSALAPWEPGSLRPASTVEGKLKGASNSARARTKGERGLLPGYTPPRSKPVDAAKEAEVFAPPDDEPEVPRFMSGETER